MVKKYPKGDSTRLSKNFVAKEFDCTCGMCKETLIDEDLVTKLQKLRDLKGSQLKITSGYRCKDKQMELRVRGYETAKGVSTHELGQAVDITDGVTLGHELEDLARQSGFTSVGVGKTFVHIDLRPGYRRWTYTY